MSISLIWAMDRNRLIGVDNKLPWKLPADMAFFRKVTMGHTIVMGRKTYESIGKPLSGRDNVVMTRDKEYTAEGCKVVHSIEALIADNVDKELIVIGGADFYRQLLPLANKLYMTQIDYEFPGGDTFFPSFDESQWREVSREQGITDEKNPYTYYFVILERIADE